MKTMKKILILMVMLVLGACSSLKVDQSKYNLKASQLKKPYEVMDMILEKECVISDWYNSEKPSQFLLTRQVIKKGGKDELFFEGLKKKEPTSEDLDKYTKLVEGYLNKIKRTYKLKDENIKSTKGIVKKLVLEYNENFPSLGKHMMTTVATQSEKEEILTLNKKTENEMTDGDRKTVRKILNKWLSRDEFFDADSIYATEISQDTTSLVTLSQKEDKSSLEKNNLNAKSLKIAFPELISALYRWGK